MSSSDPTRVKSNYIQVETTILRQIERCPRVMPIWGAHEWGSAGDKRNCCCNLFSNHKVLGMGEDNILVIFFVGV